LFARVNLALKLSLPQIKIDEGDFMKRILLLSLVALSLATSPAWAACESNPTIHWEVAGGFTLFNTSPAARDAGDALLNDLSGHGGADVPMVAAYATTIDHLTARTFGERKRLYDNTLYDRDAERYELKAFERDVLDPDAYDIRASLPDAAGDCVWNLGPAKPGRCSEPVLLTVPKGSGTTISVTRSSGETISTCVEVRDVLIVAFGDSFAAGEGNPDRPTRWPADFKLASGPALSWWSKRPRGDRPVSADWWDNTCHRSLLSQHAQAALRMAARDRHAAVTFVSFACSGATVLDGYLAPRTSSPGGKRWRAGEWKALPYRQSQINQAVELLCKDLGGYAQLPIPDGMTYWKRLNRKTHLEAPGQTRDKVAVRQCRSWKRQPDIILNAMGGNDVGFAGVAAWAILPPAGRSPASFLWIANGGIELSRNPGMGMVCPIRIEGQLRCETVSGTLNPFADRQSFTGEELVANDLDRLLSLANRAFETSALDSGKAVKIHSLYPSIARDGQGELCGAEWTKRPGVLVDPNQDEGLKMGSEPWLAQFTLIPLADPKGWSFAIANEPGFEDCLSGTPDHVQFREACVIERRVWAPLNAKVKEVVEAGGWRTAAMAPSTLGHGFCARQTPGGGLADFQKEFGWPRWTGSAWDPNYPAPAQWHPYAARPRWFRTANDSALTQYIDGNGGNGRSEGLTGTIHPTAQAHAAMADQIVATAP
jgi:hypothetical protein